MFKRILVATDLTVASLPAVRAAISLAHLNAADVVAVHVVEAPSELRRWSAQVFRGALDAYEKRLARQVGTARDALERQLTSAAQGIAVPVSTMVQTGTVADRVIATARTLEADLIVLGGGQESLVGSTVNRIIRRAKRPVLLVPRGWAAPPRKRRPAARPSTQKQATRPGKN